jgi:hypothetical protein
MARHIIYREDAGVKNWVNITPNDSNKDYWLSQYEGTVSKEIDEDTYNKIKYGYSWVWDGDNISIDPLPDGSQIVNGITEEHQNSDVTLEAVKDGIAAHADKLEEMVNGYGDGFPYTQSDVDAIRSIDYSGITFPVNCVQNSWVEALEKNSISVDSYREI